MQLQLNISNRTIIRLLTFVIASILVVLMLIHALEAVGVLLVAGFLALAVHAPVRRIAPYLPLQSRFVAAIIVFVLIAGVVGAVINLLIPLILVQGQQLIEKLPALIGAITNSETVLGAWVQELRLLEYVETAAVSALQGVVISAEATINLAIAVLNNLINLLLMIMIAFFLAVDGPRLVHATEAVLPPRWRKHMHALGRHLYHAVSGFVHGQLLITTIAASITFMLLSILGVPSPLSLAAFIWITGLIPLIGNTLGAIVVIAVALTQSLLIAIGLTIYYIIYQQVENNVLEPIVQARTTHLTPLIVLLSALIGLHLGGFVGALLAIPAGACVRATVAYIFSNQPRTTDTAAEPAAAE